MLLCYKLIYAITTIYKYHYHSKRNLANCQDKNKNYIIYKLSRSVKFVNLIFVLSDSRY